MKNHVASIITFLSLCLATTFCNGQNLSFHHGKVEFYGTTVVSDIEAVTDNAMIELDPASGALKVSVDIKSFEFEYETMQEHFNEDYIESHKFPKASFEGKLSNINIPDSGKVATEIKGQLTIHGITKPVTTQGSIERKEGFLVLKTKFLVIFDDYNIEEPSILTKSVADKVEVNCSFYLEE
jgi:polyisoprenoid-binding protein YceI